MHLSVVPPTPTLLKVFGDTHAPPGYLCAIGDVIDAAGDQVERTSIIYAPRVEMKFATSWGHGTSAAAPSEEK